MISNCGSPVLYLKSGNTIFSTMEYDVAFYEVFAEEKELLQQFLPESSRYFFTDKSIQDCDQELPVASVISIRTQSKIPTGWITQLTGIFSRSTGYDHLVNYFHAVERRISAGHLPRYAARAVAEHVFMVLLMLLRKIDRQREAVSRFHRDGLTGSELKGKTLAIIGVGNIGSEIAKMGFSLEMNLIGVDLIERDEIRQQYHLSYTDLFEAVSTADIIVCALPLTDLTYKMLDYEALKSVTAGTILVNAARGEITPPADLLRLLDENLLGGIAVDVYDEESVLGSYLRGEIDMDDIDSLDVKRSINSTLKLMKYPNVIATPHNAFNTKESTRRKAKQTAENIEHFLETGEFLTPIPDNSLH